MKTDANSKVKFTISPANPQVDVAALAKDGKFAIGITANIMAFDGLVLAGEKVTFTPETRKTIAFDTIPEQRTDDNGNVTFSVTGSLSDSANPYDEAVYFTLADVKLGLSASGVLSFIGQLPAY